MIKLIYAILAGLIGAVVVHICVLLMVPHYAQYNAWSRLEKNGAEYVFTPLDAENPIFTTTDPLFQLKACRFNLDDGPVHLTAEGTTPFWSMSIYDRDGVNFYSLNDRTTPNGTLDLVVGNPGQIMELKQSAPEAIADSVLVSEDLTRGFVILRSFDLGTISNDNHFLDSATCQTLDY